MGRRRGLRGWTTAGLLALAACPTHELPKTTPAPEDPGTLTVAVEGGGGGRVTIQVGTDADVCPPTCTLEVAADAGSVRLTAEPDEGARFTAWSGCATTLDPALNVFVPSGEAVTCTANFAPLTGLPTAETGGTVATGDTSVTTPPETGDTGDTVPPETGDTGDTVPPPETGDTGGVVVGPTGDTAPPGVTGDTGAPTATGGTGAAGTGGTGS
jgi:hypothetical protein